jgi:hypothetical protein
MSRRRFYRGVVQMVGLLIIMFGLYFALHRISEFAGGIADVILHLRSASHSVMSIL